MSDFTNGEVTTMAAMMFDKEPEQIQHALVLIITDNHMMGMRTTECKEHTKQMLSMALDAIDLMEGAFHDPHSDD